MIKNLGRGLSPLGRVAGAPSVTDPSLKGVVSSCVFDLDATQSASYGGSGQVWANLVSAPADGSAQTAYDFTLGNTTSTASDDPAFNGSAGSASAYFSVDGGDLFRLGGNTTFINSLHKTTGGSDFWIAAAFRFVSSGSVQELFSDRGSSNTGISWRISMSENLSVQQRGDSASVTCTDTVPLGNGADHVGIVSVSASGSVRFWLNSATKTTNTITYNATTADAGNTLALASNGAGGSRLANGSRIYAYSMGNSFLDDAQTAQILALYEARHGRDYTP